MGSSLLAGSAWKSKTSAHRLSEGWPPLQEYDRAGCRDPLGAAPPRSSCPFSACRSGAHSSGICLVPVPVRLQGFSPSCRFRLPRPSDRLRPVTLRGSPLRSLLPPGGAVASLDALALLPLSALGVRSRATCGRLADPASGPCSPPESVTTERGLAVRPLDAPWGSVALGLSAGALPPASRLPPSQALSRSARAEATGLPGFRSALAVLRSAIRRLVGAATLSAIPAPRFRSASFELQRPGLTPSGAVTSLPGFPLQGTSAELSRGARGGMSVPDAGRHPTLDGHHTGNALRHVKPLGTNRVTSSMPGRRKPLERGPFGVHQLNPRLT